MVHRSTWIDTADRVILEVNSWQPAELEGMHDIYYGTALPPDRAPIPILRPSDRIGVSCLRCPAEKIVAVVPTNNPDYATPSRPADADSRLIAGRLPGHGLGREVPGRPAPAGLWPLPSGPIGRK